MTVYIVTTGSYSDYSIESVWLDKKKAEKRVNLLNWDRYGEARLEEYEEGKSDEVGKEGYVVYISFETGEEVVPEYCTSSILKTLVTIPRADFYNVGMMRKRVGFYVIGWRSEPIIIYAEHFTTEQALKSARDFRACELAKMEGVV